MIYSDLKKTILSTNPDLIKSIKLNDSYNPKNSENKKSYSFSVYLESSEKTLSDKEINKISKKIIKKVSQNFDAEIRDQ